MFWSGCLVRWATSMATNLTKGLVKLLSRWFDMAAMRVMMMPKYEYERVAIEILLGNGNTADGIKKEFNRRGMSWLSQQVLVTYAKHVESQAESESGT